MPSQAFIAAASAANRNPVALIAIESSDAIKRQITTKTDWLTSALTNINATTEPGRVFMSTDDNEPYSGLYTGPVQAVDVASPLATWVSSDGITITLSGETPALALGSHTYEATLAYSFRASMIDGTDVYRGNPVVKLYGRMNGGAWSLMQTITLDGSKAQYITEGAYLGWWLDANISTGVLASGSWDFKLVMVSLQNAYIIGSSNGDDWKAKVRFRSYQKTHVTSYLSSGSVVTSSVDLGLIPTDPSRFEADDIIPVGCTITYTAQASNNNTDWTSLGTVIDGATLPAYRYYKFSAALTSNSINTPIIDEMRVIGGNSQYRYFSTHADTPIQGAKPYIVKGGLSSISSKIDLSQPSTVGELTIKLQWTQEVGDMIATGYLKNKTIICKIGFVGLAEADYEPYFVGTWYDYQADHEARVITVKTRNILKKFNRKVPAADYFLDATGKAFVPPKLYTISGNIISAMLQIADQLGVPDRFIDRAAFEYIAATSRSGSQWNVTRNLTEPMDARELLNELSVSSGVFIVEGSDGRMTAQLCEDINTSDPAATLDAMIHKFRQIDGGQKELFTRQTIYYQLLPGKDGGSASDYAKGLVYVNAQAEVDWQESATKEWMDKWGLSVTAIQQLAQRWDGWFSTPLADVKVENVPPRFWGIKTGQVVEVNNLRMPCDSNQWGGFTDGARFLVMSKTTSDPTSENLSISFDLKQLGFASFVPDPAFPEYTPFDYFPPVRYMALSERLVRLSGGTVDTILDVDFNRPADFHYGSAVIWARANGGAWIYKGQTDLGGPEDARVFSFSVTDGTTVEVAALTVNAGGQTMPIESAPRASKFIFGKTTPPEDVANFHVTPIISGGLRFSWSAVSDVDISEYVIRHSPLLTGASWYGATEIIRSAALYANLNIALPGTYFIKALDTTGHYSEIESSVVVSAILAQIALTNHAVITEQPSWAGSGLYMSESGGELKVDNTGGAPDDPYQPKQITGQYVVSQEVNFDQPTTVRISAQCDWIAEAGSIWNVDSIWAMADFWGPTGKSWVQVYISTSQDASAPANPQPLFAGDYTFQRAVFEIKAFRQYPDTVKVKALTITIDNHDTVITI